MSSKGYKSKKKESFLINITILEGRHYAWHNMNSYVYIKIAKQKAVTKIRYGTDAPFYNEYFVFEFNMEFTKFLDNHITIMVYRPKSCCKFRKILGYITLDVATVWDEVDHQFYRKWAILSSPKSDFSGPMGYLKMTISVLTEGQVPRIPIVNPLSDNEIEGNLLLPEGVTERKKALFIFKLYRGFDIIRVKQSTCEIAENIPESEIKGMDRDQLPNVSVKITFAGLTGTSSVKKKTSYPIWNESVTISELYPPFSQRIKFELLYKHKRCCKCKTVSVVKYVYLHSLCSYKLNLLPTFGPAYVHFYKRSAMGEEYVGKVLMAMETRVFSEVQTKSRCTFHDEIPPVFDASLWEFENIFLFATIANVSVVDARYVKEPISFELNWGRMQVFKNAAGNDIIPNVLTPKFKPITANKEFWYINFNGAIPCMHIINNYPSIRTRMYKANQIDKLLITMAENLKDIRALFTSTVFVSNSEQIGEKLQEYFDYVSSSCKKFVAMSKAATQQFETKLDTEKNREVVDEFKTIIDECKSAYNPKMKKNAFKLAEQFYLRIAKLLDYPQECWPNIYLWMKNGKHKTECLKFEPRDLIYSAIPESKGKYCGKLSNFYFMTKKVSKSLSPLVCKIELFVWLGLESQMEECFKCIPDGFKIPENDDKKDEGDKSPSTNIAVPKFLKLNDFITFACRVHIYQGRFTMAFDYTGLSDFFARVIIHDQSKRTLTRKQTLNPIWDQTLVFKDIVCYGTRQQIENQPPPIVLEINDQDRWSLEYVGFCLITPIIKFKNETYSQPKFPPKLQWHKIKIDDKDAGEVLACCEFFEAPTTEEDDILIPDNDVAMTIPEDIRPNLVTYRFEFFIWGVRHLKKLRHLPIKAPKVIIECSEYKIESDIADIVNINFAKNLYVVNMELPDNPTYIPPIMIKLFECKHFGRCRYAGTHISFIQEFFYKPISHKDYLTLIKEPIRTSLHSLPSKTPSELEEHLEELRRAKKRKERLQHIKWRINSVCSWSNISGILKIFLKTSWRWFKKILRFLCCLLLCCGCGRMFKKKKKRKAKDEPLSMRAKETVVNVEDDLEDVKDWWSKYFNSLGDPYTQTDNVYDKNFKIKIYNNELEKNFSNFEDCFQSLRIYRGKTTGNETEDEKAQIGVIKCKISAYQWSDVESKYQGLVTPKGRMLKNGFFTHLPANFETSFNVRIYCVRGIKLRPTDLNGACDSYLVIRMGKQVVSEKKNYIPKSHNPFYGRCFELEGLFPRDNCVTISIYDWDKHSHSDLIGQTKVDLENRFYSKHRATCGLPYEYILYGDTPWRDTKEPTEILHYLCQQHNLPEPQYISENRIIIGHQVFTMEIEKSREDEPLTVKREMLALFALHKWQDIPVNGFHLVPEHVETRSLYRADNPGIEQGKLQMWIDIFPIGDAPMPHQVNIRTRAPVSYELRVIIWNTEAVLLNENDFFGDRKSDIYVKGWLTNPRDAQETDVHYRSMTGEGNFNWRFIFAFDYLSAENVILEREKQKSSKNAVEQKLPCRLTLQVWDNDVFSKDDFLGTMTLYLNRMPRGAKLARQCTMKSYEQAPRINLFKIKRTRGWWPFLAKHKTNYMKSVVAGKVDAEFELVTAEQAGLSPAGLGRNAPEPLPPPKRPATSFNWLFNPWRTCRFIVWNGLKWKLVICLIVVLVGAFFALFIYALPGATIRKIMKIF